MSESLSLSSAIVCEFLRANFDKRVTSVNFIGAGWLSQAFSFRVHQQEFIFRVNASEEGFKKDAFAYHHFSSLALPIPKVIHIGRFDDARYFAITERCEGRNLKEMDDADILKIVPRLFETLDALHSVNVSDYRGWGLTDAIGNGCFETWHESILSLYHQRYAYEWTDLAKSTFLEKSMYEAFVKEMKQLLSYCPSEKYLIHRDLHFKNLMSDGHRITGVLDWADYGLGDFVYDIAYLDYCSKRIPIGALWREYAASKGYDVPHFEERMRCYMLSIGLIDMAVAALRGDEKRYVWIKERMCAGFVAGKKLA